MNDAYWAGSLQQCNRVVKLYMRVIAALCTVETVAKVSNLQQDTGSDSVTLLAVVGSLLVLEPDPQKT